METAATVSTGPQDASRSLLAAIQSLVSRDRILDEQELLLATVTDGLTSGARTCDELLRLVAAAWPGVSVSRERLQAALDTGLDSKLLVAGTTVTQEVVYSLTPMAMDIASDAASWVDATLGRTARELRRFAAEDFEPLELEDAELLVPILAQALGDAVREGYAAYLGDVELLAAGSLVPRHFDRDRAVSTVLSARISDTRKDLLLAAIAAAFDTSRPFGNELLGHLVTACILQAYLGRAGQSHGMVLGPLAGEEFVVETPLLLALIGPHTEADPIARTIRQGLAAGCTVTVPEHCLEELRELVENTESRHLAELVEAIKGGMKPHTYALAVDAGVLQTWVRSMEEGRYQRWPEFRQAALDLPVVLAEWGVTVRVHGNVTRETVDACREALVQQLQAAGSSRKESAIDRDAQTMAMVLRHRAARFDRTRLWPGSWIVTPDRQMRAAYLTVRHDSVPLSISAAQWAVLLTRCDKSPTVQALAATAPILVHDVAFGIATRYPPHVALELATTLSEAGVNRDFDVHSAQLSLDDLINPSTGETPDGTTLASGVLAKRARRLAEAMRLREQLSESERRTAEEVAKVERGRASATVHGHYQALEELQVVQDSVGVLRRRSAVFGSVCTLALVLIVVFLWIGWYLPAGATTLASLVFARESRAWRSTASEPLGRLWIPLLIEFIGVLQFIWSPGR